LYEFVLEIDVNLDLKSRKQKCACSII